MRRHGHRAAGWLPALSVLALAAHGCGSDGGSDGGDAGEPADATAPPDAPPADAPLDAGPLPFDGEPTIRMGTGCDAFASFTELEDGARLPLERGTQGLQHFWLGVRGWNLTLDDATLPEAERRTTRERTIYRALRQSDESVLAEADQGFLRLFPTPELGDVPFRTNLGQLVVQNDVRDEAVSQPLIFEIERVHEGERLVHRIRDVTGFLAEPCEPPP